VLLTAGLSAIYTEFMHDMDDDSRKLVLGEALFDELRAIRELVSDVPAMRRDIAVLKEDVAVLKSDVAVIKTVVKDHSRTLNKHQLA
jgi:hypothetical protein